MVNPVPGSVQGAVYKQKGRLWSLGYHTGTDRVAPNNTPIVSAMPGIFKGYRQDKSFGINAEVCYQFSGHHYHAFYCHMDAADKIKTLKAGDKVAAGQRIGGIGLTGNTTGYHCHIELRAGDFTWKPANFRDPKIIIDYKIPTGTPPASVKLATIRPLWYNIPGPDKLKNDTQRAKDGAALVKSKMPSVLGCQELVGRAAPGKASAFANKFNLALGATYTMLVPTTNWNENYIFYQKSTTSLVKQMPDKIIKVKGQKEGKHLSLAVFLDIYSQRHFVFGNTHLSNGKDQATVRGLEAIEAMKELKRVSVLYGNCPIFVGGDMNRSDDLRGFVDGGLVNMRKVAKNSTNANYSTYVSITHDRMTTNPEKILDQGYMTKGASCNGYTVMLGYDATNTFPPLRPSDHVPIVFSVTF